MVGAFSRGKASLVGSLVAAGLVAAVGGSPAGAQAPSAVVVKSAPGSSAGTTGTGTVRVYDVSRHAVRTLPAAEGARLITKYWTPARRAAAIPLEHVAPAGAPAVDPAAATATVAPRTVTAPVAPKAQGGAKTAAVVNFSFAVGKVFFTDPVDGLGYQCSASTVNSAKLRLVWTAGHCVHGGPGKQWMTNWAFEPGYQRGVGAPGVFPYYQLWAQSGWFSRGDYHYDYGVGITWNNAAGWKVVDRVGGNGLTVNPGRPFVTAIGYPSNFLEGETQSYCQNTLTRRSIFNSDQTLNCNRGAGASGEPWLRDYNNNNGLGYIVSDNSYSLNTDHSAPEYGPYYDGDTAALYNAAENASPN
jgi:V8-like Glu-specific endopeptidase